MHKGGLFVMNKREFFRQKLRFIKSIFVVCTDLQVLKNIYIRRIYRFINEIILNTKKKRII